MRQRKICEMGWMLFKQNPGYKPDIQFQGGVMSAVGFQFNQYRDSLSLIPYGAVLSGVTSKPRVWIRYEAWTVATTPYQPVATSQGTITNVVRTSTGLTISITFTSVTVKETKTRIALLYPSDANENEIVKGDAENALGKL